MKQPGGPGPSESRPGSEASRFLSLFDVSAAPPFSRPPRPPLSPLSPDDVAVAVAVAGSPTAPGLAVSAHHSVMSWLSWASLVPTLLVLSATVAWWFTEPKNARINLIAATGAALFGWAIAPELCRALSYSLYLLSVDAVTSLHLDHVVFRHAKMLVTGVAVVWYVCPPPLCPACPRVSPRVPRVPPRSPLAFLSRHLAHSPSCA